MLFVYLEDCQMFSDVLVPLHPAFNVARKNEVFVVNDNEDFVDVFSDYRLHIMALCGKNGAGKSTFLRLLNGRLGREAKFVICWIDHKGEVACNRDAKVVINGHDVTLGSQVHHFSLSTLCGNENLGEENSPQRSFLEIYSNHSRFFDFYQKPIFDGFHLELSYEERDLSDLEEYVFDHWGLTRSYGDLVNIIEEHPVFHVLASIGRDSTFENLAKRWKNNEEIRISEVFEMLRDAESDKLDSRIRSLIYHNGKKGDRFEREEGSSFSYVAADPNWELYEISEYQQVKKTFQQLSKEVDQWISNKRDDVERLLGGVKLDLYLIEDRLLSTYSFRPYQQHKGKLFHLEDLSSGERWKIKLLFDLAPRIWPQYACWFFDDDADEYLHPEWKRNFVNEVVNTYEALSAQAAKVNDRKIEDERVPLYIVATHSPFILSDLPNECILHFEKNKKGRTTIRRSDERSFGGNIGELFHTEFFMKATIGEFARQRIEQTIRKLEKSPTTVEFDEARKLFSLVGDTVLRQLLFEKIEYAKDRADKKSD